MHVFLVINKHQLIIFLDFVKLQLEFRKCWDIF